MALYSKTGSYGIPKDAVQLSREDAIVFMQDVIHNWKTSSEVFYVNYGAGMLSGMAAMSGIYFNNYYRNRMRLLNMAKFTTFLPSALIPSSFSFLTHLKRVQEPILIGEKQCGVCLEIRATALQLLCGIFYPLVLTPLASFMMAVRCNTYNVPPISKDPKALWLLYLKLTRPLTRTISIMAGLHVIAAGYVTYKEAESVMLVTSKLKQLETEALESEAVV